MSEIISAPLSLERDGISQSQRRLHSLDPKFVGIDERTLKDWLAFCHAYSKKLKYYNLDNQANGNWSSFLNPNGLDEQELLKQWQEIETFLDKPEGFDDSSIFRRPHFVLFLTFLHLLGLSQHHLNQLTRRHLDFYYKKFLSLQKQPSLPDRVNVLVTLSTNTDQLLLPAGTPLDAGKDSTGKELIYCTNEDVVINQVKIKSLYSVFVHKKVTGIQQAREETVSTMESPLLAMFKIVYGDPLPTYLQGKIRDSVLLTTLGNLVNFVSSSLYLDFHEFRNLMGVKTKRYPLASKDWTEINRVLTLISEKMNPTFTIQPPDSRDFKTNLRNALNGNDPDFVSLRDDIQTLEDVYKHKDEALVQSFIKNKLQLELKDFTSMMVKKIEVDNDWLYVNALLEIAGQRQRKNPDYRLPLNNNPASPEFDTNLKNALGDLDFSPFKDIFEVKKTNDDLDRFWNALQQVETYFYCSLEDFALLIDAEKRENQTDTTKKTTLAEWERVYSILATAYAKKTYADRRSNLDKLRSTSKTQQDAMEAMLRLALGENKLAVNELLSQLDVYWLNTTDKKKILDTIKIAISDKTIVIGNWEEIINTLELTWRNREGSPPVAKKEQWLNLYATKDAASVKAANQVGTPRWHTFGQGLQIAGKNPPSLLGWFIVSPMFCLSHGQRKVTLTLVFKTNTSASKNIDDLLIDAVHYPFQIEASSEKVWITPTNVKITSVDSSVPQSEDCLKNLLLELNFDESLPPITVPTINESQCQWPMIRLLLRADVRGKEYITPYPLFQSLVLERVLINVSVQGLKDLYLENDEGLLLANKPFEPFGSSPAVGSGFQFVHPELVLKRLDRLDVNLQWMKVPVANLTGHYKNYPNISVTPDNNDKFTVKISLLDHGLDISLKKPAEPPATEPPATKETADWKMFETSDAREAYTISIIDIPKKIAASRANYIYAAELKSFDLQDSTSWIRYWRFELNAPDFQHGCYAQESTKNSIALATAIATGIKPTAADYQVNPPYTPKLKSFSVDYESTVEIIMNPAKDATPEILAKRYRTGEERIFYQQAFGVAEIQPEQETGLYRFLPSYDFEGELYIGLQDVSILQDSQDVSILFQMAEGSANPDLASQTVVWSYLSGNRWLSLQEGAILDDGTGGLLESGIIKFRLSKTESNTLLPDNLYWLRAAIKQYCDSVCDTIAIHAQAVSATWVDQENALDHLNQPLPANTITKTVDLLPGIQEIAQPYSSYGGKLAEQDSLFNTRISERLRHKQRALSLWDYEHLILENFPGIYKVKCIPATSTNPNDLGKVDIIVIPDIRNHLPFNPFEPKATAGQIADINAFLANHVSPLAEIKVKNAHYVPVRTRFAVRFMPGCDPGFYKTRINEELNRFLSPWAYEESNDVVIGGKIYANIIVDFLERRPYVDYVAELKLFINEDGLGFKLIVNTGGDTIGYHVQTDRPDGVLVADQQHEIDLITEARFDDARFTGIGYMKIELDFIVTTADA